MLKRDEKECHRRLERFEGRYWSSELMNGAFPICHEGCALRVWLVVSGEQAGRLWEDRRSEYAVLRPVRLADGSAATFSEWYREWLQPIRNNWSAQLAINPDTNSLTAWRVGRAFISTSRLARPASENNPSPFKHGLPDTCPIPGLIGILII